MVVNLGIIEIIQGRQGANEEKYNRISLGSAELAQFDRMAAA